MYARVSTYVGTGDQTSNSSHYTQEHILPALRKIPGWKGVLSLTDRRTGKGMSVTLWESEAAMRASEEEANRLRAEVASSAGQTVSGVERYEVEVYEVRG